MVHACPLTNIGLTLSIDPGSFQRGLNGCATPLSLSSVSSQWRRVAHSTPQLWSTFTVKVRHGAVKQTASLIRLYLDKSGDLPVSIGLNLMQIYRRTICRADIQTLNIPPAAAFYPIRSAFDTKPQRDVTALYLFAPPFELLSLCSLPHLQQLWIEWPTELLHLPHRANPP
ncbi:hypothetical protein D9756_002698 [Leucocoprinus leucothites]|uniref:F-box domain-containing protein n=1 Tax=Leucocoprinus leucothites TaxID=201217 RepID=A0A8H5GCH2_9AGAR|nr:hypothetical protein D9756_002698 [Leucoagaricus leucothites]